MAQLGINAAGRAEQSPSDLAALGAKWVRVVGYPDANIRGWIQGCHDAHMRVLMVLASESVGQDLNGWEANITTFRDRYGSMVDAWQIGNEADHVSPSSWSLSQVSLSQLYRTARTVLGPSAYLVGAGMASGQPGWLQGVDLGAVDAIACHPYAKEPNTAALRDLLNGYLAYQHPFWVTEYHARTLGMAAYLKAQASVTVALAFCYSDSMVKGFGLKEDPAAYADFVAAAKEPVIVNPPAPKYSVGAGIAAMMKAYGTEPATSEDYRPDPNAWSYSEAFGMDARRYVYLRATRQVLAFDPTNWADEDALLNPKPPAPPTPTIWPSPERVADILGAPLANVKANWPLLNAALVEQGIGDRATVIAAIATVGVESSSFLPIEEYRNADGSIPDYWNSYDGGPTYHGRGLIQLTHRYNYAHFGAALGVDLAGNPALALDPTISARVFALYFKEHNIKALANKPDWYAVRVAVNGSPPNGWQRFADLVDALVAL